MEKCFCFLTFLFYNSSPLPLESLLDWMHTDTSGCEHCVNTSCAFTTTSMYRTSVPRYTSSAQRGHCVLVQQHRSYGQCCNAWGALVLMVIVTGLDYRTMHDPCRRHVAHWRILTYPYIWLARSFAVHSYGVSMATAGASVDLTFPMSSQLTADVSMAPVCSDNNNTLVSLFGQQQHACVMFE